MVNLCARKKREREGRRRWSAKGAHRLVRKKERKTERDCTWFQKVWSTLGYARKGKEKERKSSPASRTIRTRYHQQAPPPLGSSPPPLSQCHLCAPNFPHSSTAPPRLFDVSAIPRSRGRRLLLKAIMVGFCCIGQTFVTKLLITQVLVEREREIVRRREILCCSLAAAALSAHNCSGRLAS